jgi:trimeric autotransporter adhesin
MKINKLFSLLILLCLRKTIYAQQNIGIGTSTPNASALLDIKSSTKGLLIPRINLISETDVTTIVSPQLSLLIYNSNNTLPDGDGYYYWGGNKWTKLATRTNLANLVWNVAGNTGTNPANDFIGTTDPKPLIFKTNNILSGKIEPGPNNVFFGQSAGLNNTLGSNNSFFGHLSGTENTTGEENTFLGRDAGKLNTTGARNTIVGEDAGVKNTIGNENTFIGNGAGRSLNSNNIIAIGKEAFGNASPNNYSIALGDRAGHEAASFTMPGIYIGHAAGHSSSGSIAIGDSASFSGGNFATIAIGNNALRHVSAGDHNTALGFFALENNTTGDYNLASGPFSLNANTSGTFNVAIGNNTLDKNITGNHNTALGSFAGVLNAVTNTDLENTTAIGSSAKVSTSNTMVFGDGNVNRWAFGLSTTTGSNALQVGNNSTNGNGAFLTQGGNWTNTSSQTKKEDFSDVNGLELLKKIQQMSIRKWKYKGTNEYHIGPVAEDFYKLFELGVDDKSISTVDPAGIALAAIKEQQRIIQHMQTEITLLKKMISQNK